MHVVFQLHVLRFDSTVVIDLLINIICPKLNHQVCFNSNVDVYDYASRLASMLKAEIFL